MFKIFIKIVVVIFCLWAVPYAFNHIDPWLSVALTALIVAAIVNYLINKFKNKENE